MKRTAQPHGAIENSGHQLKSEELRSQAQFPAHAQPHAAANRLGVARHQRACRLAQLAKPLKGQSGALLPESARTTARSFAPDQSPVAGVEQSPGQLRPQSRAGLERLARKSQTFFDQKPADHK